ncbi:hypothetical protein CHS0354_017403, partial [Potamilus streckersoni]
MNSGFDYMTVLGKIFHSQVDRTIDQSMNGNIDTCKKLVEMNEKMDETVICNKLPINNVNESQNYKNGFRLSDR